MQDVKSCGQAGCHSLPLMTDTNADLIGGTARAANSDGTVIVDDMTAPFPRNTTDRVGIYLQDTIQLTIRPY